MIQICGKGKGNVIYQLRDLWPNTRVPGWVRVGAPYRMKLKGKVVELQEGKEINTTRYPKTLPQVHSKKDVKLIIPHYSVKPANSSPLYTEGGHFFVTD